jgi:RNA polymerase subunit RPABC4/transcription elongation factor Spt4
MSRQHKNGIGLLILLAVIVCAFFLVNPLFRFSCSRIFLHDFMGMDHTMLTPGVFFSEHGIARMLPLMLMFLMWGAVSLWAYHDAEQRGHSGLLWGLFVFVGNIIGLIIYLIVRSSPEDTALSAGPASTAPCPRCAHPVQKTYVACPHCGTSLTQKCAHCEKPVELDWKVCPYCGQDLTAQ